MKLRLWEKGAPGCIWRSRSEARRAPRRWSVLERLQAYRRYFESGYPRRDHGGQLPLVLFVFESEHAGVSRITVACSSYSA